MKISFNQIELSQIEELSSLAHQIWNEFFTIILSNEQIDYMVDKFLSPKAIKEHIEHKGYTYYFIKEETTPIGFIAIRLEKEKLFLSKLYLQKSSRGKGYASLAFDFIEDIAKQHHKNFIYLTVNKYNNHSIDVYKKKGFIEIDAKVCDIGHGYVMDDFIMEKVIDSSLLTEQQKMIHGYPFLTTDKTLTKKRLHAKELLYDFNLSMPLEISDQILKQLLGTCGKNVHIDPHFHCHYGKNIHVGNHFYAHSHCIIYDEAKVLIGEHVILGPNVSLLSSSYPIEALARKQGYQTAKPIIIGNDVHIGANTTVLPGVIIGDRSVILEGSVVTEDIPEDSLATGNPCRIIRKINQEPYL